MKKSVGIFILLCFTAAVLMASLAGCTQSDSSGSILDFSYSGAPADTIDEKDLYINEDLEKVTLSGELKMNSGEVIVQVSDEEGASLWEASFDSDTEFHINLYDLTAGTELHLTVQKVQCDKMNLRLKSEEKLVKNQEKPLVDDKEIPEHTEKPQ